MNQSNYTSGKFSTEFQKRQIEYVRDKSRKLTLNRLSMTPTNKMETMLSVSSFKESRLSDNLDKSEANIGEVINKDIFRSIQEGKQNSLQP